MAFSVEDFRWGRRTLSRQLLSWRWCRRDQDASRFVFNMRFSMRVGWKGFVGQKELHEYGKKAVWVGNDSLKNGSRPWIFRFYFFHMRDTVHRQQNVCVPGQWWRRLSIVRKVLILFKAGCCMLQPLLYMSIIVFSYLPSRIATKSENTSCCKTGQLKVNCYRCCIAHMRIRQVIVAFMTGM